MGLAKPMRFIKCTITRPITMPMLHSRGRRTQECGVLWEDAMKKWKRKMRQLNAIKEQSNLETRKVILEFLEYSGIVLNKLANLYISIGDNEKAALCFEENLKRLDIDKIVNQETAQAMLFLAKYFKSK